MSLMQILIHKFTNQTTLSYAKKSKIRPYSNEPADDGRRGNNP